MMDGHESVQQEYERFWKGIVERDGVLDFEQVKRELYDYSQLLERIPVLYCRLTDGAISKPNTDIDVVYNLAEEVFERGYECPKCEERLRASLECRCLSCLDALKETP